MAENVVTYTPPRAGSGLSMAASPVVVELDGRAAPWLSLVEVKRRCGPKLNQALFRVVGFSQTPAGRFEDLAERAYPGQSVVAWLVYQTNGASGHQAKWPLFAGVIRAGQASMSGEAEGVEVSACDALAYGANEAIAGIRALGPGAQPVWLGSSSAVFNEDGRANCSVESVSVSGRTYQVFALNEADATRWTYAAALRYLAGEYLGQAGYEAVMWSGVEALTAGQTLDDVDVSGLDIFAALERLCQQASLAFGLAHVPVGGEVRQVLHFFRAGMGRQVHLRHQGAGEALDLRKTNVVRCEAAASQPGETLQVTGWGDLKRFEGTFALTGGWAPALEANDYDLYSPITNEDFLTVRDVFRKWVLNEEGDYSGPPYEQGPAYDLSGVFGTSEYSERRRRFWPCLSRDAAGQSLGYFLEVSYDSGTNWQVYPGAFDVLLDECGVSLTATQLDITMWNAIKKGALRFRMTATLVSDERLAVTVTDGPVICSRPVRRRLLELGGQFKYEQVSAVSIFHNGAVWLGAPVRDDSKALRGLVREQLRRLRQNSMSGQTTVLGLRTDLWPGDVVRSVQGREANFERLVGAGSYAPQVRAVRLDADKWISEITFGEG